MWIEEGTVSTLSFVSLSTTPDQQRMFEEAHLRFNEARGELHWNDGRSVVLEAVPGGALPKALQWLVHEHLS